MAMSARKAGCTARQHVMCLYNYVFQERHRILGVSLLNFDTHFGTKEFIRTFEIS